MLSSTLTSSIKSCLLDLFTEFLNYKNGIQQNRYKINAVFTVFFFELQNDWRYFSSIVPKPDSLIPKASSLRISRGIGDCQRPSHQAGGRSGVWAHWLDWFWQLNGPANLFQTCPQPTCNLKPSASKLLWKLLKNEKLEPLEFSPAKRNND